MKTLKKFKKTALSVKNVVLGKNEVKDKFRKLVGFGSAARTRLVLVALPRFPTLNMIYVNRLARLSTFVTSSALGTDGIHAVFAETF
jgi:hypothetical protein